MRGITLERKTNETDIKISLNLDGNGVCEIDTGIGFFDHMLELFAAHGGFDLKVQCKGDIKVDFHHSVEDVGILLGDAFLKALGDKKGITRYGSEFLPMDESLILTAVDLSGRDVLVFDLNIPSQRIGSFDTELVKEFFTAFTRSLKAAVHIKQFSGENSHHIVEGAFKSLARSLKKAVSIDKNQPHKIPSTKGVL